MVKVVLVDVDDTLLSFSGYVKQTMKEGFFRFGLAEYEDAMYLVFEKINNELWRQIEEGTLTFEKLLKIRWNRIFKELEINYDGETFEKYFRERLFDSAVLEPGATDLLDYLSKKYILGVASNGPYHQQMNRLQVGGLHRFFQYFFISEKIGAQKPSKDFFDYCMTRIWEEQSIGFLPEEVMIIGDSISSDIAGGKQYGFQTCLYTGEKELRKSVAEADYQVRTLMEIKTIL